MAAVIGVCVMIGAATAVSERASHSEAGSDRASHVGQDQAVSARSETVAAYGPTNVGAAEVAASSASSPGAAVVPRVSAPASLCPDHHRGLRYYRQRHAHWNSRRGVRVRAGAYRKPRSCPDARYLAVVWRKRAARAQQAYHRWARNRYRAWLETPEGAIRHVFGPYAEQALRVSSCETGGTFDTKAENGQYLGLFQMGSSERARYGHGRSALEQARAAYRYFVASGRDWSPWSCKP